jgi:HEAT repeat protein
MFRSGFGKKVAALEREYRSESSGRRERAATELKQACYETKDPSAALPLIEAMVQDPHEDIGDCATSALCRCGAHALPLLMRLFAHSAPRVRERACYVTGHLDCDTRGLHDAVFGCLSDADPATRAQAAFALGRMDDRSAATLDALAAAIRDPASAVRMWALSALGRFGDEPASRGAVTGKLPDILPALADADARVRQSAVTAIEALELPAKTILGHLLGALRSESVVEVLGSIRHAMFRTSARTLFESSLPDLLSVAAVNRHARPLVFEICGDLGERARAALPQLKAAVAAADASFEAVRALWTITRDPEACVPALERLLDRDWFEASQSLELLTQIVGDDRYVVPMLERALEKSPDEPGMYIQEHGNKVAAVAPALARAMERNFDEGDWDVMWNLTCAMAGLESVEPVAIAALGRALEHESGRVAGAALNGLKRAGPAARSLLPKLRALAERVKGQERGFVEKTIRAIEKPTN